jgi:hypothetical protein
LYRMTLPSKDFANGDRTLAFTGMISNSQTVAIAEIGALWAIAWLEDLFTKRPMPLLNSPEADRLTIPSPLSSSSISDPSHLKLLADAEIRFTQAFLERRYGLRGARAPELIMEARHYIDLLCHDLGVEVYRKKYRMRERNGGELPMEKVGFWAGFKDTLREWFEPYVAPDFKGVVQEFLRTKEGALDHKT